MRAGYDAVFLQPPAAGLRFQHCKVANLALDAQRTVREVSAVMMKLSPLSALPLLALAACNSEPETINANPVDPNAAEIAAAPPVQLPPSLLASRTYRCKDNSLVYIDFFSDNLSADLRAEKTGTPTKLTAAAAGEPFKAEGYTLTGNGETVTLAQPGKPSQSCKA